VRKRRRCDGRFWRFRLPSGLSGKNRREGKYGSEGSKRNCDLDGEKFST